MPVCADFGRSDRGKIELFVIGITTSLASLWQATGDLPWNGRHTGLHQGAVP